MNAHTPTVKKILNALAFANVNNLGEFRALLHQIDAPAGLDQAPAQHGAISPSSGNAAGAPLVGCLQGAL